MLGGVISGGGGFVQGGNSITTLTAINTYTGPTTVSTGTLQLGTGASGQDGTLATGGVANNATLVYDLSGSQSATYAISGSGGLVKTGSGTLTLAASQGNSYTGPTVIQSGTLKLAGAPLGTPINVAFQNAAVNGYTGTGPLGASGTAAWNVFASGAANSATITTTTLSNLLNASSASVSGTKFSITAGSAGVFTTAGASIPLLSSYAFTKTSVTFSMSGLTTQPYTVYAISSFQNRSGSITIGGVHQSPGCDRQPQPIRLRQQLHVVRTSHSNESARSLSPPPQQPAATKFDISGLQFVPDVGSLPSATAALDRGRLRAGPQRLESDRCLALELFRQRRHSDQQRSQPYDSDASSHGRYDLQRVASERQWNARLGYQRAGHAGPGWHQ